MSIAEKLSGLLPKAEANAAIVDAVRDAERVVATIEKQHADAQSRVRQINGKLDEAALANVGHPTSIVAKLRTELQAARDELDLLDRAKKGAGEKLAEARAAQRQLANANQRKVILKFCKQRSDLAAGMQTALAEYARCWAGFHSTNAKLQISYPGGRVPGGSLITPGEISRTVIDELWRVGGNPFLGGTVGTSGRADTPTLPGAPEQSLGRSSKLETLPTLVANIELANAHLLKTMDGAAEPSNSNVGG